MKEYLKMADVFGGADVGIRKGAPSLVDCCGVLAANCLCPETAEHIAHAINSHDELVAMNKELLEALKMVWSSAAYAYDGISGQYVMFDDERELINSLLERCSGGAS